MSNGSKLIKKAIRRKVQIVGGNTVTVSLPRSWADHHSVGREEGDNEEIELRYLPNGSLMVSPTNSIDRSIERVHFHKIEENVSTDTLKRIILADFIGGIDIIRLRFKSVPELSVSSELHRFVNSRLIGFDMIESDNYIEIINMTQSVKFEVTRLMEILRVKSKKMLSSCLDWIKDEKIEKDEFIEMMDQWEIVVDRQTNQMMRTLQLALLDFWIAEKVNLPMAEILYWSTVTKSVESTADLAVAIAHISKQVDVDQVDKNILKQIFEMGESVVDLYSRSLKSFIKDDYMESYQVLEEQAETSITIQKKWPTSIDHYSDSFILIMVYLEKIMSHARKIAEASIDCEGAKTSAQHANFVT